MCTNRDLPELAILCGGKGTRLKSVISDRPKALATIGGRPFLEVLLVYLARFGYRRVVLCVGFQAEKIISYFNNKRICNMEIVFSREEKQAGTGGAVADALHLFNSERVLVVNGDTFCMLDHHKMLASHENLSTDVTMVVVRASDCSEYGAVLIEPDGRVSSFVEKGVKTAGWVNAGVYLFPLEVIKHFPRHRPFSLENEILPELAAQHRIRAFKTEGPFFDIGTPERYVQACKSLTAILNRHKDSQIDYGK